MFILFISFHVIHILILVAAMPAPWAISPSVPLYTGKHMSLTAKFFTETCRKIN
jgi:hypothetical protein